MKFTVKSSEVIAREGFYFVKVQGMFDDGITCRYYVLNKTQLDIFEGDVFCTRFFAKRCAKKAIGQVYETSGILPSNLSSRKIIASYGEKK